jgi:hypothetical protein
VAGEEVLMSVPKGRRQESRFEAQHNFYKVRAEVTALVLNDFGFSEEKYRKKMEKYRAAHAKDPNINDIVARWERKNESFKKWFIDEEARAIIDIMREIEKEFTVGNSIFPSETPSKVVEFLIRRQHVNRAIGLCYALKQEIHYVIRTLPVDINKFERFAEMIDRQIALYKGVRQADNRLIKPRKPQKSRTIEGEVTRLFDSLANIIRKIGKMEQTADDGDQGDL